MSGKILLTIAIPTYNRAEFLGRAMDSVIAQMTPEIELLISDNASKDGTEALVREKMRECPAIRYLKNPENIGPDANFLQCLKEASGEYVLLLGDDDLVAENAIGKMLAFLKEGQGCALIFLNHCFFKHEYRGLTNCSEPFLERKEGTLVTTDKDEFLRVCSHRLTYMSALLLSKEAFDGVSSPEKYVDTYFIHTCVALEATKGKGTKLGMIFSPCIAQDSTPGNSGVDRNLSSFFHIFGACFYRVYCEIAPQFGYELETARGVFRTTLKWWSRIILKLKSVSDKKWKSEYKKYGKPILKQFKGAYLCCLPILLLPNFLAKILHTVFRPIYRKIKHIEN